MRLVIDASAAVEMALSKEKAKEYKEILKFADLVLVPDTYPSEITNVFWKYGSIDNLEPALCQKGIEYCMNLVDDFRDTKPMCIEVLSESLKERHPAYDLFYLVLARRTNSSLLSKDKKMLSIAEKMGIEIIR